MKNLIRIIPLLFVGSILLTSCEVADPFVDRIAAPVLVLVAGDDGIESSGLTTEPTVTSKASTDALVKIRLLALDKTGILDYKVGIDSIPAKSVSLTLKLRTGVTVKEVSTGNDGVATFTIPWSALGIAAPKAGTSVALSCSGKYDEISFTKLLRLTAK